MQPVNQLEHTMVPLYQQQPFPDKVNVNLNMFGFRVETQDSEQASWHHVITP
jgi:hypothetical protein